MTEPAGTLALLRERTAAQHRALDALSALTRPLPSRADYAGHLRAMLNVVHFVETTFYRSLEWQRLVPDHEARLRAALLAQDLADLGVHEAAGVPPEGFVLRSFAEGLGAAYVLEGSTLGGTVLAAHVRDTLGPGAPTRFLTVHGARVGPMWKAFCRTLEATGASSSRDAICDGAVATFEAFRVSFEAVTSPSTPAPP